MDYSKLAAEFIEHMVEMRKSKSSKAIGESAHGELFVLRFISKQSRSVTPSEISDTMSVSTARIAATLNNLENKGLITRQIDKSDRRKILVDITPQGKETAEKHYEKMLTSITNAFEELGENDAKEFVRIWSRFIGIAAKHMNF